MAGLISSVTNLQSSGLSGFLVGRSAASLTGQVEQFRNNLVYDYGYILAGAASDGTIFDIRVNSAFDYEFGRNLSFRSALPNEIVDTGDALSMQTTLPRTHLEQQDVARMAFGLLLASKGEIDEEELNSNPAFSSLNALTLKDALDRLNVDVQRRFRINGVEFEVSDDHIRINSRPGEGASQRVQRDAGIEALRRRISQQEETLPGGTDKAEIDGAGASIVELVDIREELEGKYTYVAYDFVENVFVGSNDFADMIGPLASVPDGFFFGSNMAFQMGSAVGDDLSMAEKETLFPAVANFFANMMMGALTGLPTQLRSEFEDHARTLLTGLYRGDEARAEGVLDTLRPYFESSVQSFLDAIAEVPQGAELDEMRRALGISVSGGSYTAAKFAISI